MSPLVWSSLRRWLQRGVIIAAALATIATSQKRWQLVAPLPAKLDPKLATVIVVEASHEPKVESTHGRLQPLSGPAQWPGSARYLIPAGVKVADVRISEGCGSCNGECVPPSSAFVRVVSATPTATWTLTESTAELETVLDPTKPEPVYHAEVSSSAPVTIWIESSEIAANLWRGATSFEVTWYAATLATSRTIRWRAHARIEVPCPTPEPCTAPSSAFITLGNPALRPTEPPPDAR